MKHGQSYLKRQNPEYLQTKLPLDFAADIIVVIPCYNEEKLFVTLNDLAKCRMPDAKTLVAVIINSSICCDKEVISQNRKTYEEFLEFVNKNNTDTIRFFPLIFENLPRKHAGVGLARKIGMDLAVEHFLFTENREGIIVSLDADCTVSPNFLTGILAAYRQKDKTCCTVQNFYHRIENNDPQLENAIRQYEQHLRNFSQLLQLIGFPYHYHTIGSAFSVTADAYVRVGGMGRQQGGEDFYFLQKIFALGKVKELNDVFVYPMARYSNRIPFGTGPALQKITEEPDGLMKTYNLQSFRALKEFFDLRHSFFKQSIKIMEQKISVLHPAVVQFVKETDVLAEIEDCNKNCATLQSFEKRFFHHFNAFKIIKFLNFSHATYFTLENLHSKPLHFLF